jgi:uncharacterized protein YbjQ (UPF0145 family)
VGRQQPYLDERAALGLEVTAEHRRWAWWQQVRPISDTGITLHSFIVLRSHRFVGQGKYIGMNTGGQSMQQSMTTTSFSLEGHRITAHHGVVRGITVRSRSIFGTIGAGIQTLFGGDISLFSELCEKTRADSFSMMLEHAEERGANAVIGIRYDGTEVMSGVSEVLCYGTAVTVVREAA